MPNEMMGGQMGGNVPMDAGFNTSTIMPAAPEGDREAARARMMTVMKTMEQDLATFGTDSEEGQSILKSLQNLSKTFGTSQAEDITPAENANMVRGMNTSDKRAMMPELMSMLQMEQGQGQLPPELGAAAGGNQIPPELMAQMQGGF